MAKEALKMWMDLPIGTRRKILSNVWCPDCRTAVTICDYSAELDGGVVVLRGFCGICGHKVARVLEGCGESSRKTQKCGLEYYIFDVWLYGDEKCTDEKRIIFTKQVILVCELTALLKPSPTILDTSKEGFSFKKKQGQHIVVPALDNLCLIRYTSL